MNIEMIKTSYRLNPDNVFEQTEQEQRTINEEHYQNIIEAKQFFLNLGGTEKHFKKRTPYGNKVVKIISISPDKTMQSIYDFKFN